MRRSRRLLFNDHTACLELLRTRICDLDLRLQGTILEKSIRRARRDLLSRGILLRPNFYLSTEYGTVPVTINIGLGFWDANEHLRRLNLEFRRFHYSDTTILNVIRHEVGHAFCYSYKLYRTREFRRLFRVRGHFFATYPATDRYGYNPWSKEYISPTGQHYAQKHPDEDFAEAFTEFLRVKGWKRKHRAKPGAIRKLEYVQRMIRKWGRREPLAKGDPNNLDVPVEKVRMTVAEFFRASLARYRRRATGFIDEDLLSIFRRKGRSDGTISALHLLRRHRRELVHNAVEWARIPEPIARDILDKVAARAKAMKLVVRPGETRRSVLDLNSFVTSMATRYGMKGRFRR